MTFKLYRSYLAVFIAVFAISMLGDVAMALAQNGYAGEDSRGTTLGGMIKSLQAGAKGFPGAITGLAYLAGLIFGVQGVMKLREHVESPNHVPIWDPMKRFVTGGAFFSLPFVADVVRNLVEGDSSTWSGASGFNGKSSGAGLDAMIVKLMADITQPTIWIVSWFGWLAGLVFVFIGISRLMKSEQEGPRGPTGIGTIMTFVTAGFLFSLNSMISYATTSIFGDDKIKSNGVLKYTDGLGESAQHVHAVISAIIAFAIVIGWISIVRGFFIVRGVSEGNSQASMMAAITHIIGGTLAINLGSVINAVQSTLGITTYGITFN